MEWKGEAKDVKAFEENKKAERSRCYDQDLSTYSDYNHSPEMAKARGA